MLSIIWFQWPWSVTAQHKQHSSQDSHIRFPSGAGVEGMVQDSGCAYVVAAAVGMAVQRMESTAKHNL